MLTFRTEADAGYHVGRCLYQQFIGPLYRSHSAAASIVVGEILDEGRPASAQFLGYAITLLSVITLGVAAIALFVGAESIRIRLILPVIRCRCPKFSIFSRDSRPKERFCLYVAGVIS